VVKAKLLDEAHRVGVFHSLRDLHAAGTALAETVAVQIFINSSAHTVDTLMYVDAGLDGFLAKVRAVWDFDFLILFDELDNRHLLDRNRSCFSENRSDSASA